ncbi:MAG: two-component system, response regulator [Acidimicrobiales bacterium]|nr:two-component system, response regulator [Acidimicrobiales bacterium]
MPDDDAPDGASDATPPVRLLIVDDHELFATSMSRLLDASDAFTVVGVCANASSALETLATTAVDVVTVDLRLAGEDGTVLVRAIRDRWPDVAVLVVSGSSDAESVRRAAEAGCNGYLLKGQPIAELVAGIAAVARGERVFAPDVARLLARDGCGTVVPQPG